MLLLLLGCGDPVALQQYLAVINVAPSHGAANISPETSVLVTFNDDLATPIASWAFDLRPENSDEAVYWSGEYSSSTYTQRLQPDQPLESGTRYVLTIGSSNPDLVGQTVGALPAPVQTRFTTATGSAGQGNTAPVAVISPVICGTIGETIPLDGGESTDPDGDLLVLSWRLVTGPAGVVDSEAQTFVPDEAGAFLVGLVANDGQVDSSEAFVWLTCPGDVQDTGIEDTSSPD